MEQIIHDEKSGLDYQLVGEYYLPMLRAPEIPQIGRFGRMHYDYIRKHNKVLFSGLWLSGEINGYIEQIDRNAEEMFSQLVKKLAESEGVTEQLKNDDQMAWVCKMENIDGVSVFPQGYAAVFDRAVSMRGQTVLCDIGNGTMNILFMKDGKPNPQKVYTEKFGTAQCVNAIKTAVMDKYHARIDKAIIEDVFKNGTADISADRLKTIREVASDYVKQIFDILKRYDYEPSLMKLYVVGGGGLLLRNFGSFDRNRVIINDDICATVKGYEKWAEHQLSKADGNEHAETKSQRIRIRKHQVLY